MVQSFRFQVVLSIGLIFSIFSCTQQQSTDKTSGALDALDFMYQQRAFPNKDIPSDGFYRGYESAVAEFRSDIQTRGGEPAPWDAIGPHNTSGRTLAVAFNPQNPNTIYAGSASGGLWRSTSLGAGKSAWEYVKTGHPVLAVSSIAIDPRDSMIMYIGTGEVYSYENVGKSAAYRSKRGTYGIGILKTEDGGDTWSKSLDWSYDQLKGVNAVELAPSNPDIIYAATSDGIYKSKDAGINWSLKLDVHLAMDVAIHPTNSNIAVAGCGNFGSDKKGIYVTTDGGDNWVLKQGPLPTNFKGKILLDFSKSSPNVVYASIGNGFSRSDGKTWLCRSDDAGNTWQVVNNTDYSIWQGWFAHDIAVHPQDDQSVVAVGIYIHKTTDGGATLTQVTKSPQVTLGRPKIGEPDGPPTYTHIDHHVVRYHPDDANIVLVASDGGVFISFDGGQTYESRNGGYQTAQFYNGISVFPNSEDIMLGGLQDNSTAYHVGDKAWHRLVGGDGSWTAINPDDQRIMYASWQNLNIVRTNDEFKSTRGIHGLQSDRSVFIAPYVLSPSEPDILYGAGQKVYKTTDGGDNWIATNNGNALANGHPFLSLAVSPTNSDIVWGGTAPFDTDQAKPKLFYTLDGGKKWNEANNSDLPNRYPTDVTIDAQNENIVYVTFSGYGTGHLFKSEDYGTTWIDLTSNLPDLPGNAIMVDPLFENHLYYGNDMGVFSSTNGGLNWEDYSNGLHDAVLVMDLKIADGVRKLFVGTHGSGAYKRGLIGQPTSSDIVTYEMDINVFPNPAINKINFSFAEINAKSKIDLRLFNLKGNQIHQSIFTDTDYEWKVEGDVKDFVLYEISINGKLAKSGKIAIVK